MSALDRMAAKLRQWREDPVVFVREVFGAEPDAWQVDVLRAFVTNQKIALKACKGPGKTCVEAWLIWNFLLTRPHPKVICTSITEDNLKDCLWTELSVWYGKSDLLKALFDIGGERIASKEHPKTWFASARTWPKDADKTKQADSMAGIHGEYTLVVIDEVSDIPDGVVVAAEASLSTGTENRILIAGNPTRTEGPLYRACTTDRAKWWVYEITGDPDDPKRAPRISLAWAREQIAKWGSDNPWVLVNVFGKFPPTQSDKLLGPDDVGAAAVRNVAANAYFNEPRVLGVDCARFGDDRSVLMLRQGPVAYQPEVRRNLRTDELGDVVMRFVNEWKVDGTFIDEVGLGAGAMDHCTRHGFQLVGVNNGRNAADDTRFANKWSEMWWDAAAWVKRSGCLPNMPELLAELQAPRYWFDKKQRVVVESNDDCKARLGHSLDLAQAFINTFAGPVLRKDRQAMAPNYRPAVTRARHDFDPFADGSA